MKRPRVLLSSALHPHYARVIRSYVRNLGLDVVALPLAADGRTDIAEVQSALQAGGGACVLALQSPNFLGCVEDLAAAAPLARRAGALLEVVIAEPFSLGLLHGPGRFGADMAVGEASALGAPLLFGGPYLGFMAARESMLRQMPGRLVGEAQDAEGRRGYVLTLSTREQHIRREKATSNICTNQGLMALAATIGLSLMGNAGLREAALQCHSKAVWARQRLAQIRGCRLPHSAPVFNEFVLEMPADAAHVGRELVGRGIVGGLPLGPYFPDGSRRMLFCLTEMNTREEIERLALALEEILR